MTPAHAGARRRGTAPAAPGSGNSPSCRPHTNTARNRRARIASGSASSTAPPGGLDASERHLEPLEQLDQLARRPAVSRARRAPPAPAAARPAPVRRAPRAGSSSGAAPRCGAANSRRACRAELRQRDQRPSRSASISASAQPSRSRACRPRSSARRAGPRPRARRRPPIARAGPGARR